ncbi:SPOC like C-terminal domain-containing protein [Cokeromyces recurvatus]|uniref:SPOC like C-terminal domain-containing protein n=1 Tax=Cokeromyces recurvatus TaxID=90255 RepID=UPI002220CBE3|nr:SPOC like C-terminal domain-containing protein [Cokeromyces recurvatus]KAI7901081.1 SPOC like C-terminal domain-containing protein [Cokeromyces recurvatus]
MPYNDSNYHIDDKEEDSIKPEEEFNLKQCTIYAIDCRSSMIQLNEHGEIPLLMILKSIRLKCLDKINSRSTDQMGLILFGTREKNNSANKDNIYVLQPLDILDAPRMKEIDMLIQNISFIKEKYGSTDELFPISDLFWVCSDIMLSAPKLSIKRVILITDNDDPTSHNPVYRKTAIQRVKDLNHVGVECIVFGLDRVGHTFDKDIFYKDISYFNDYQLKEEKDDFKDKVLSYTGKLSDLFEKIKTFQTTTRSGFRLPLQIAPNLIIGIRGYNMIIEQKIDNPRYFYTSGEQLKEVKSITRWKCADTNEILTSIDIKTSYNYGGEKVILSKQDIEKIQTVNEPGILVLGFRELKALKAYHQISHPYFIYPDEMQYKESKNVFFLLLNTLLNKGQMAICSFVKRLNTIPKIVALLPQAEKIDKNGNQIDPPGFQLIILPFADEIRNIPPYTIPEDFEYSSTLAKRLIEKFTIKEGYNPTKYHNPFLQNHKNLVQKIALDNDHDLIHDAVTPNYHFIESNLSNDIEAFKKSVGLDTICLEDINNNIKRKTSSIDNELLLSYKKSKTEELTVPQHWEANTLNNVTNNSLKEFLLSVGIHPKKLKADLVCQVDAYLKTKVEEL